MIDTENLIKDILGLKPYFTVYINSGNYEKSRMVFLEAQVKIESFEGISDQIVVSRLGSEVVIPVNNLLNYTVKTRSNSLWLEVTK